LKSPYYLERILAHPRAKDMLKLFPNSKEVTETFGAWEAVQKHLPHLDRANPDIVAIVIGDGHSPRTGALIAMSTSWEVHSIDPLLRPKHVGKIKRLATHRECFPSPSVMQFDGKKVVVVAVHSHAGFNPILDIECTSLDAVAIPCCVPHKLPGLTPQVYADTAIWSPERNVHIWKGIK